MLIKSLIYNSVHAHSLLSPLLHLCSAHRWLRRSSITATYLSHLPQRPGPPASPLPHKSTDKWILNGKCCCVLPRSAFSHQPIFSFLEKKMNLQWAGDSMPRGRLWEPFGNELEATSPGAGKDRHPSQPHNEGCMFADGTSLWGELKDQRGKGREVWAWEWFPWWSWHPFPSMLWANTLITQHGCVNCVILNWLITLRDGDEQERRSKASGNIVN